MWLELDKFLNMATMMELLYSVWQLVSDFVDLISGAEPRSLADLAQSGHRPRSAANVIWRHAYEIKVISDDSNQCCLGLAATTGAQFLLYKNGEPLCVWYSVLHRHR